MICVQHSLKKFMLLDIYLFFMPVDLVLVWIALKLRCVYECCVLFFFFFFFFLFSHVFGGVRLLFNEQQPQMLTFFNEQCIRALFTDPQISFFINFFIKNGSYGTIYTFKNYFATVISAISFQFQQNKSYPNRPLLLFEWKNLMFQSFQVPTIPNLPPIFFLLCS